MTTKQLMDAYLNSGSKHVPNIHKKYKFIQGYCDKGWLEVWKEKVVGYPPHTFGNGSLTEITLKSVKIVYINIQSIGQ